ncbi:uncharacterized protein MONOS_11857 [Monocercomonoides exilis]|uniref:uncharacterized protein n=1 Tax=Monocercomonoides exilis TaxID=2049356 RepID=UPI003559CEF3|nr:hypothetical protein MONOS_11857 [Monocercomonoides exilis]|eukprot:MONOS_11857.1-p1 / transcript=MONOS_11857.1 / gene=MONOS_11857 / organism=Monocercomonoides_exilis_PA203 / gene_product=unspecified product / transcript_product=unspecified product / location=Mono_scaffold00619:2654-7443(-) / protein_length=1569 / sequence_SO=supercontig / SO=protein_coding / is_pseudo=false
MDVKGCEFNSVSNVYYGGIVSSINSRGTSLCAFNSSFGSCSRTRNVEFEHNESMDRVIIENDLAYTFIFCEWHSPGVIDRGAAILLHGRPVLLNVSHCLFEECNVTYYYGAIYAVYIDSVKINGSNFTHYCVIDRQTEDGGGGAVGSDSNNETVISSCIFENCQSSFGIGALFLHKNQSADKEYTVSSSTFISNKAAHVGGAMTIRDIQNKFYIRDCLFERNSANKGGAIHFENVLPIENSTALVLYCLFVDNKAEIGNDVLMNDTANINFARSPFIDCFSTRKEEGRVVHVNSTENVRDEWIPVLNCIYVSPEGEDTPVLCGLSSSSACKSIGYVAQKCVSSISIQLTTGVLESEIATVRIENQGLNIIGEGVESSTLVNNLGEDCSTFFVIGGGTLSESEMTIMQQGLDQSLGSSLFVVGDVGDPGDLERRGSEKDGMLIESMCDVKSTGSENDGKAFGRPWFVVKRGSAELRNVNVMDGVFEGSSAMFLGSSLSQMTMMACSMRKLNRRDNGSVVIESEDGGSVEVNNCSFIDCNAPNSEWGGGMRAVCLHPEGALVLKNKTTIRSCCASMESGRGGGICVKVDGGVDGFMLEEIGFDGNKAAIGRDVYFECEDLSQSVNRTSFGFAESIEDRKNSMCGRDCTFFRSNTDLFVFLSGYFGTEIKADKTNGRDEMFCGREIACRSLEYSQTRLTGTEMRTININISATMDGIIELECHTISSMGQGLADILIGVDLNEGSSCGMNVRGRALFEQIRFQLPISLGESQEALVHCCSSVSFLKLVGCAFVAKEENGVPLKYCLILSLSGKFNLTRCTLSNLLVGIAPFCLGRECEVLVNGMIAQEVTVGKESLFLIPHETDEVVDASVKTFIVEHSAFEEIHTATGTDTSALLCVDLCRELDLNNCTIKGAFSEGSKEGGGMKVRMGRGGFLRARGVSSESVSKISLCSCSETIGKGGFLWLSCEDDNHNYQLSNLLFETNTASVGKNLFVRCSDLNETTTRDRYNLDMSLWERTGNEFVGEDINRELWNETVDLMYFLELYGSDVVSVSSTGGYDVRGCGSSLLACRTFLVGHSHSTSKGSPQKKIILENSATIGVVNDLSSFCICSMGPDKARVQFEEKIKKGEIGECVMLNTKEIEFESILFVLPSRFEGSMNTLISSKEPEGKVCLRKCAFANETSAPFSFHIARIGEGVLSIVECNMGEIGFGVSPFVLGDGTASSFKSLVVDKIKLSDESLLKIVHTENGHQSWTRQNTQHGSIAMGGCIFQDVLKEGGNSAGILSSLSGMSVEIEGCEFERVISRESISGGCLNVVVGKGGCLQMNGSVNGFECECESSRSGRGGFVFIESREEEDGLSLEGLRFRDNKAHSGRDMYIMCQDLVESVSSVTFAFALEIEEEERGNSLVGRDERRFREEEDLFILITGYFGANVIVSEKRGVDNAGCGKAVLPCCSVDWGASHLNRVGKQQVVIEEEGWVNGEVELTNVIVEAANERGCAMNVNGSVSGESAVVMITRGCTFKDVGFVLPGKFVNGYRVVVEGAGEMEVLVLLECSFRQEEMKKLEAVVISV